MRRPRAWCRICPNLQCNRVPCGWRAPLPPAIRPSLVLAFPRQQIAKSVLSIGAAPSCPSPATRCGTKSSQPGALKATFADVERSVRLVLTTPEIYHIRRIVLTGSGNSRFAAKAVEMAMLEHAGVAIEVRPPMEAGRYHAELSRRRDLENTLLIALSNSGAAAPVLRGGIPLSRPRRRCAGGHPRWHKSAGWRRRPSVGAPDPLASTGAGSCSVLVSILRPGAARHSNRRSPHDDDHG